MPLTRLYFTTLFVKIDLNDIWVPEFVRGLQTIIRANFIFEMFIEYDSQADEIQHFEQPLAVAVFNSCIAQPAILPA